MQIPVCSASLSRIYLAYREFKTHLLVLSHAPDLGPALPLCWNTSTASIFSLQSFKIALLTFKSLHTIVPSYLSSLIWPYVPSRSLRSSSAHRLCVPRQFCIRLAGFQIGRSSNLEFLTTLKLLHAPPFILSRNSLRHICLPQPSPLVELSLMRLWFDCLLLFIYLVVLDFVHLNIFIIMICDAIQVKTGFVLYCLWLAFFVIPWASIFVSMGPTFCSRAPRFAPEASFRGAGGGRRPPQGKRKKEKKEEKKRKEKKREKKREKERRELWMTSNYYIQSVVFFQFFNSPVALKNKKIFCPPKKKLKWRPWPQSLKIPKSMYYVL